MLGALFLHFNLATQLLGGSAVDNVVMNEQYLIDRDKDSIAGRHYTIEVPLGGRMEFSTITIPSNVTLKFLRNQMNDPVYLLAKGDVTIAGTIDVSGASGADASGGAGGPGGYDGGEPGFLQTPGDGHGPGGGKGAQSVLDGYVTRSGSYAGLGEYYQLRSAGGLYGSPSCFPLIGGSGGAGADNRNGGGGGGGAILIGSNGTLKLTGSIRAQGGSYAGSSSTGYSGSGSGGCVRLVAQKVVMEGQIDATSPYGYGGKGHVRIDTVIRNELLRASTPMYTVGSNMVVRLESMPIIQVLSADGVPRADNNSMPVIITTPGRTSVPIVVDVANFQSCVALDVMAVPASGAATTTTYLVPNGLHDFTVPIPANTATSIEVYGKATACPPQ